MTKIYDNACTIVRRMSPTLPCAIIRNSNVKSIVLIWRFTKFCMFLAYYFHWLCCNFIKCFFAGGYQFLFSWLISILIWTVWKIHNCWPVSHCSVSTTNAHKCENWSGIHFKGPICWMRATNSLTKVAFIYHCFTWTTINIPFCTKSHVFLFIGIKFDSWHFTIWAA